MKRIFIIVIIVGLVISAFVLRSRYDKQVKEKEDREFQKFETYKVEHPEENKNYAILAAKYTVDALVVQNIMNGYREKRWREHEKNIRKVISEVAKQFNVSDSVVASILIDYSYLTSDCSQTDS